MGNGVYGVADGELRLPEAAGVIDILLCILHDPCHGLHCLHRVFACGGLPGEHYGAGTVIYSIGHIGDLRPGGPCVIDHGLQHLRGGDGALAHAAAGIDELLLDGRQLLEGYLHTQIATGHHDAVTDLADLLQVVDTRLVFDFGDNADGFAGMLGQEFLHIQDILLAGDKGAGHVVHPIFHPQQQIRLVLLTEIDLTHNLIGKAHALIVGKGTSHHYPTSGLRIRQLLHSKDHEAVVEQDPVSYRQITHEASIAHCHPALIPYDLLRGEGKGIPLLQLDTAASKGTDTVLRALGIQHNGDGQAQLLPDPLD